MYAIVPKLSPTTWFRFAPRISKPGTSETKWSLLSIRFALFPTTVGITPRGNLLKVWLEPYLATIVYTVNPYDLDMFWVVRCPLRDFDGVPFFLPDKGINDDAYKGS